MNDLTPVPDPEDEVLAAFTLPQHLGDVARDAFREVLTVRGDLEGSELVALEQAVALIDNAERLEAIARAADWSAIGSQGQPVLHWAVQEIRQSRSVAATVMHRLVRVEAGPKMTNSERARAAAQARWQNTAGRGGSRGS